MTVFTRSDCAYCPMVKKYLTIKNISFEEKPAEGVEYEEQASKHGFSVPLIVNGDKGMTGYNIPRLMEIL